MLVTFFKQVHVTAIKIHYRVLKLLVITTCLCTYFNSLLHIFLTPKTKGDTWVGSSISCCEVLTTSHHYRFTSVLTHHYIACKYQKEDDFKLRYNMSSFYMYLKNQPWLNFCLVPGRREWWPCENIITRIVLPVLPGVWWKIIMFIMN